MAATNRTIADIRASTRKHYLSARLWEGVYAQDKRWVPRGAWTGYAAASMIGVTSQECIGELDGEPVVVGPAHNTLFVRPDLTVDGTVAISDMGLSWRQSACSFLWRRSHMVCVGLAWGTWHFDDPCGFDIPDEVLDDAIRTDLEWEHRAQNEAARREWFEGTPLVTRLRASIVEERDARVARPVLLGAQPETPAAQLLVPGR